jgi:hypothetical protein
LASKRKDGNDLGREKQMKLMFDIKIATDSRVVYCMSMERNTEIADPAVAYSTNEIYEHLCHSHKDPTRATSNVLALSKNVVGVNTCNACTVAQAKQKNVAKASDHVKSEAVRETIFLDISSIKHPKKRAVIPKPQWKML